MAEERVSTRGFDTKKTLMWTELFRTFLIALDPFKLLIAAAGILIMSLGWWTISAFFFNSWTEPKSREGELKDRKNAFVKDGLDEEKAAQRATFEYDVELSRYLFMKERAGAYGTYRTMPWSESRGPNPCLVTTHALSSGSSGPRDAIEYASLYLPPVVAEPLLKFFGPVFQLFNHNSNFWVKLYLICLIVWMLITWAFFGGIISRMAIVQIAGKEGGGLREAYRFVRSRYLSYLLSPIVPILLIFAVVIGCVLFGILHLIPVIGDIFVDGLFWWVPLGAGFVMSLLVVGLVGYPLMYSTLSAEGSDTFDALSRSYNYVYESPWSYIWYGFISILYGAVCIFFVVFWTSMMVYLGKWGISQTPLTQSTNRSPEYLFIYSPTSFGWRELMLQGSPAAVQPNPNFKKPLADDPEHIDYRQYVPVNPETYDNYMKEYSWYNYAGAGMVSFWMTLLFILMLGFGYSYFWTASSMIYLLMRKKVDEVDVDEIYTEDEEFEEPVSPPKLTPPPSTNSGTLIPSESLTLRVATPAPAPAPRSEPPGTPPTPSPDPAVPVAAPEPPIATAPPAPETTAPPPESSSGAAPSQTPQSPEPPNPSAPA